MEQPTSACLITISIRIIIQSIFAWPIAALNSKTGVAVRDSLYTWSPPSPRGDPGSVTVPSIAFSCEIWTFIAGYIKRQLLAGPEP